MVDAFPASGLPNAAPGWFGKLPCLGDFAQRRMPAHCLHACDAWLSAAMRHGQDHLGEPWLARYRAAAPLRFGWAPGVVDAQWWFGLLVPSCDSAGRHFPLLVAQARAVAPADRIALNHLELWFDHVLQACVRALQAGAGAGAMAALEDDLQHAPAWPMPVATTPWQMQQGAAGAQLVLPQPVPLAHWLPGLAEFDLTQRLAGCSVWWPAAGTAQLRPAPVTIAKGLPAAGQFLALLGADLTG